MRTSKDLLLKCVRKLTLFLLPFHHAILILRQFSFNSHCLSLYGAALWNITCKHNSLEVSIERCYYLIVLPQEIVGLNLTSFENLHA